MTSTRQVISSSAVPRGLPSSIGASGSKSPTSAPSSRPAAIRRASSVRFIVASSSRGRRAASSAARCTRWCTLHVVGVAVVAVPVVADQDVGLLLVEDVGQAAGRFVEIGAVQGVLGVVLLPAAHAGVGVPEPDDPIAGPGPRPTPRPRDVGTRRPSRPRRGRPGPRRGPRWSRRRRPPGRPGRWRAPSRPTSATPRRRDGRGRRRSWSRAASQKRADARFCRPRSTRGSSLPTAAKSPIRCSRAGCARLRRYAGPASTRRSKASST